MKAKGSTVTKATSFGVFNVNAGIPAAEAISFAQVALNVAGDLLTNIVSDNDRESAVHLAFAARFLMHAAEASYRAAGVEA